ncbi:MAG: Hpt domain-containing protein [Elusimicrobiaceae bacterium]|nr:Hpt domain-containing protein [Elusimicrobiaceae bacterium]
MNIFFDDKPLGERARARAAFFNDAEQYLKNISDKLLQAEDALKAGAAPGKPEINEIFRCAHNIKSMGAFTGLAELEQASHTLEELLSEVRQEKKPFDRAVLETALAMNDRLHGIIKDYAALNESSAGEFASARGFAPLTEPEPLPQAPGAVAPSAGTAQQSPVPQPLNPAMLAKFVEDAEHGIEVFNDGLLRCEAAPATENLINELFRAAHNLKSTAGFIGATELARASHAMEDLLAHFRKTAQTPDSESLNVLFAGIDLVRDMVQLYKTGTPGVIDAGAFIDRLNTRFAAVTGAPRASVTAEQKPAAAQASAALALAPDILKSALDEIALGRKIFKITAEIPGSAPVKSINAVMAAKKLSKKGRVICCAPDAAAIVDSTTQGVSISYLFSCAAGEEEIRNTLKLSGLNTDGVEELTQEHITNLLTGSAATNTAAVAAGIRVDARKLDRLMDLSGELVTLRSKLSNFQKVFAEDIRRDRDSSDALFHAREHMAALKNALDSPAPDAETLRACAEQLESCVNTLSAGRQENAALEAVRFDGLMSELNVISGRIQTGVMSSRMVAIEGIFSRFKRIVRDVAKAVDKDVTLVIEGQETELDKTIVDSLTEPLTHMVRNAVDHGLEPAGQRRAAGKPERGTVCLRAYRMGSSIRVEVRDDGRGMDPEAIAAAAVRKGVLTEAEAGALDRGGKLNLIFKPGFSTAETVTGISGRGVGMDVVLNMVLQIKGSIDIETAKGRGTAFVLKIPLTLSVIKALLCTISNVPYALPIDSVHETALVTEDQFSATQQGVVFARRDELLPFCDTQALLGIPVPEFEQGARMVAILNDGGRKAGVAVHKMLGEDELVLKPLPRHLAHLRGIAGVSVLGNGNVAYILDPVYIISSVRK